MKHTNTHLKIQGRVISGKQRPLPGTPRDSPEVFTMKLINYTINQKNRFPPKKSNLTGIYNDKFSFVPKP